MLSRREREAQEERERMPYIEIEAGVWVVMREDKHRPKAVIERVVWVDGNDQYLLKKWHSDPAQRRLVGVYESVADANREVKWTNNLYQHPSRGDYPPPFMQPPTAPPGPRVP